MLINKKTKTKGKRRFIFGAVAFASLASMATMSLVSCKHANDTTKPNESDKDVKDPVGFSVYAYLNFKVRASDAALGIKFIGDTSVKIKKGHQFGAANPPKVVCPGYTLSHWEKLDGTTITRSTVIDDTILTDDAIDVYPKMIPASTGMTISGREKIYDGVMFSEDIDPETSGHLLIKSYDYTAHVEGITDYSDLEWSVIPGDDETNIHITPDEQNPEICHVETYFTDEIVSDTLHAELGQFSKDIEITILPPFYTSGLLTMHPQGEENNNGTANDSQQVWDMGKSYWIVEDGMWMLVDAPQICAEEYCDDDDTVKFIQPAIWEKGSIDPYEVNGKLFEVEKEHNASTDFISGWTDIYPGAGVVSIGSYFMANFADANPVLHAGANYIASIGEGFMLNCESFNQDVTELFVEDIVNPIRFGNYFMYGCTSFNNAQEDEYEWVLPLGSIYGNNFLGNCTSLAANCILPTSVRYIGANFMNDCDSIPFFGIPANSQLRTIEAYFLAYCPALSMVSFQTDNIDFFADIDKPWAEHGAFITSEKRSTPTKVYLTTDDLKQQMAELYPATDPSATSGPYRDVDYDPE